MQRRDEGEVGSSGYELRDVDGVGVVWLNEGLPVDVAGCAYYQDALERVVGPRRPKGGNLHAVAWLVPEPENEHDENAVRVDIMGTKVGYVPRDTAGLAQRGIVALNTQHGRPVVCQATVCCVKAAPIEVSISISAATLAAAILGPRAPSAGAPRVSAPGAPAKTTTKQRGIYMLIAVVAVSLLLLAGALVQELLSPSGNSPPPRTPASTPAKAAAKPTRR